MNEQEFDAKLKHIDEQAALKQDRGDSYRERELAKLFVDSGWSRQQLAERVSELLRDAVLKPTRPKQIKKAVVKRLAAGEWHTAEEIAEKISPEFDHKPVAASNVKECLRKLVPSENSPYRVEKTGDGDTAKYRIVKVKGTIVSRKQIREWSHELIPMLELLIREAKKDRVEISTPTLCELASKIKKILESMVAKVSTNA